MTAVAEPLLRVTGLDDVARHVGAQLRFGPPRSVGAELELFAVDRAAPQAPPSPERVAAALAAAGPLPGGSVLSTEPGGQVELSSLPCAGPAQAAAALSADLDVVRGALAGVGVALAGLGADPARPPVRQSSAARYVVMEAYFAGCGGRDPAAGRSMMCSSAAVQVSVDAGLAGTGAQSAAERWRRAHALGPALVAAFACSPLLRGAPTGWRSTRQRFWLDLDPGRTAAPSPPREPVEDTTRMAMGARVLTVRGADGVCRPAPPGLVFGDWVRSASPPTTADLDYHLTTLFPPVRSRGWFEVRYLDALPGELWQVALAVVAALLDDDRAADAARQACAPVEGRWSDAARVATADRELARAAAGCLLAAAEALPRRGAPALAAAVTAYAERYPLRGRCPADDLLDAHAAGRSPAELLLAAAQVAS